MSARRGRHRLLAALALALAAFLPADATLAGDKPTRIVSLNMCTDELVLRLAAPGSVASVTWLSQDPRNANMAEAARRLPANHGLAEEVLALKPDLVVVGTYTARNTVALLRRTGIAVAEFGIPANFAQIRRQILDIATTLGEPERGEALVSAMDTRLAQLEARKRHGKRKALVLRPNGFTAGRGSLIDEILTAAGLDNLAADLGIDSYGQIALETVVLERADILILDTAPDAPPSLAHETLRHPVLSRLGNRLKLVALPSKLWTCAGPSVLDAVELLIDAAAKAAPPAGGPS